MRRADWCAAAAVAAALAGCGQTHPAAVATHGSASGGLPAGAVPTAVAFWTARRGLIGGVVPGRRSAPFSCQPRCRGSFVALTTDGGHTWRVVWRGGGRLVALRTAGRRAVWQAFTRCADLARCTAWAESSDSGRTWHVQAAPGPMTADPCRQEGWSTHTVVWPRADRGWALCITSIGGGGMIGRAVLETADAGHHWRVATDVPFDSANHGMSSYGDPEGIDFLADGHGWLWQGPRGVSMATTDGGHRWRPLGLGTSDAVWICSGWFVTARIGYALLADPAGDRMTLERTATGGAGWTAVRRWRLPGLD